VGLNDEGPHFAVSDHFLFSLSRTSWVDEVSTIAMQNQVDTITNRNESTRQTRNEMGDESTTGGSSRPLQTLRSRTA
jgi:hypothetical protein